MEELDIWANPDEEADDEDQTVPELEYSNPALDDIIRQADLHADELIEKMLAAHY